jgi:hypothetical protein
MNDILLLRLIAGMTIYRNETTNGTVEFTVVMDTAGVSVLVSATAELLNVMVMVGNNDLKGTHSRSICKYSSTWWPSGSWRD